MTTKHTAAEKEEKLAADVAEKVAAESARSEARAAAAVEEKLAALAAEEQAAAIEKKPAPNPVFEMMGQPGEGWEPVHTSTSTSGEWARYTRLRQVGTSGSVLQTETIVRNPDGSYALSQATVFVPR